MGDALSKISDVRRWGEALVGFATAVWDAGPLWAHPLLLVAALAIVVRFVPAAERRTRKWLWIPIAATLAAEYGLFLVTTADLSWILGFVRARPRIVEPADWNAPTAPGPPP